MKKTVERLLVKTLKMMNVDLLAHAHVQAGAGHNCYQSGEFFVADVVIAKLLGNTPSIIFDVGANIGEYTKMLNVKFPNAKIHSFEPVLLTFLQLKQHVDHPNIILNNCGFGEKAEELELFISLDNENSAMATLYPEALGSIFQQFKETEIEPTRCKFITIDHYCTENKILSIDYLKIDVEGHELKVLRGAIETIRKDVVKLIQFEFNEFNIISKSFMKDFYNTLPNYSFFRIMASGHLYPLGEYTSSHEIFRYQNILAIHNSVKINLNNSFFKKPLS